MTTVKSIMKSSSDEFDTFQNSKRKMNDHFCKSRFIINNVKSGTKNIQPINYKFVFFCVFDVNLNKRSDTFE